LIPVIILIFWRLCSFHTDIEDNLHTTPYVRIDEHVRSTRTPYYYVRGIPSNLGTYPYSVKCLHIHRAGRTDTKQRPTCSVLRDQPELCHRYSVLIPMLRNTVFKEVNDYGTGDWRGGERTTLDSVHSRLLSTKCA
jgi:hypothetical protein